MTKNSQTNRSFLEFAMETAYLAGRLTLGYFQAGTPAEFKERGQERGQVPSWPLFNFRNIQIQGTPSLFQGIKIPILLKRCPPGSTTTNI
ncbi:MAG: hypothetical protein MUE70_16960 [Desulfobacterales bacterium]|nr:hypothetical protein [Desulfobacterales bacterium]